MIASRKSWVCVVSLLVMAVTVGGTGEALAGKKNKDPNRVHKAHGKVVAVVTNADGTGSITLEQHKHKHKKNGAAAAVVANPPVTVVKTYEVIGTTQFVVEKKAGPQPATLGQVHKGEHVSIEHKKRIAEKVDIGHSHHKKHGKKKQVAVVALQPAADLKAVRLPLAPPTGVTPEA